MLIDDFSQTVEPLAPGTEPELTPLHVQVSPAVNACVIVAHPDDETLWAGGMILANPEYSWFIAAMCRKNDLDRSHRFNLALQGYRAAGTMGDLEDGPEQIPLPDQDVQQALVRLLPSLNFDLLLTHAPAGEYTSHRRHAEVSQAVMALWQSGVLSARELWLFAYEDDHGRQLPQAIPTAHHFQTLSETIWQEKYRVITEVYGFDPESWEARATPQSEAFWCFGSPAALQAWLDGYGQQP